MVLANVTVTPSWSYLGKCSGLPCLSAPFVSPQKHFYSYLSHPNNFTCFTAHPWVLIYTSYFNMMQRPVLEIIEPQTGTQILLEF